MSVEAKNTGYAVKLDGKLSLRTASDEEHAAMINGLVLFFGVDPRITGHWTEAVIREIWADGVSRCCDKHKVEIVKVRIIEEGEVN